MNTEGLQPQNTEFTSVGRRLAHVHLIVDVLHERIGNSLIETTLELRGVRERIQPKIIRPGHEHAPILQVLTYPYGCLVFTCRADVDGLCHFAARAPIGLAGEITNQREADDHSQPWHAAEAPQWNRARKGG